MADEGPARTVTSKVLRILGAYESGPAVRTLTELAEAADIPLPTAHRLVGELVDWGALKRDESGRYRIGLRLWKVAQNAGRQLRETARPYLMDLFALTGETSQIAIRDGHEALYVDRMYSSRRIPRATRIGGKLPLHATAVGKVLLAFEEPWMREAYLARKLEALTPHTHVNPSFLRAEIAQIVAQHYAIAVEEVRLGTCSIAVPVMVTPDHAVAAIGLVLPSSQAKQITRHLPALQRVAAQLEPVARRWPNSRLLVQSLADETPQDD
ncbi:IclR family transcriptional regulator [Antrihabitans stalactiti]|uniref:IclR family transcriptional regulator n=1 Tax=Antrihabitans stalactiti TaxID=2584121 RepID=A0A848KBR3_9NOCA|nr:IclR family transcriptional regulator [Antrihabitans stalactiti]NMN95751.1 IclR family transcriptional regulator [Antrihabitans stalactiti]